MRDKELWKKKVCKKCIKLVDCVLKVDELRNAFSSIPNKKNPNTCPLTKMAVINFFELYTSFWNIVKEK